MLEPPAQASERLDQEQQANNAQEGEPAAPWKGASGPSVQGVGCGHDSLANRQRAGEAKQKPAQQQRRPESAQAAKKRQQPEQQVPLRHGRQRIEQTGARLVDRLKQTTSPD